MFDHNKFVLYHHNKIIEKGYWDKPKEIGTLFMLIVTEVTKLFDENRLNKPEKLADITLRIYDICGYYKIDLSVLPQVNECTLYSILSMLTNEIEAQRVGINTNWVYIKRCLSMVYLYAEIHNIDLEKELYRKSSILGNMTKKKF